MGDKIRWWFFKLFAVLSKNKALSRYLPSMSSEKPEAAAQQDVLPEAAVDEVVAITRDGRIYRGKVNHTKPRWLFLSKVLSRLITKISKPK